MTNLFNQESNDRYKSRCLSQPPNYYSSKPWFLLFKGLKSAEKIYLTLFAFKDYLPQLTPTLAIKKWDCSWEEYKIDKRKDKIYTCKSRAEIIKELNLILEYSICSLFKNIYLIDFYIVFVLSWVD